MEGLSLDSDGRRRPLVLPMPKLISCPAEEAVCDLRGCYLGLRKEKDPRWRGLRENARGNVDGYGGTIGGEVGG